MTELGRTLRRKGDIGTSRFPRDGSWFLPIWRPAKPRATFAGRPMPRAATRWNHRRKRTYQADYRWREDNDPKRGTTLRYISRLLLDWLAARLRMMAFNIG